MGAPKYAKRVDANHAATKARLLEYEGVSVADTSGAGSGFPDMVVGIDWGNGLCTTDLVEVKNVETIRGQQGAKGKATAKRQREFAANWRGRPVVKVWGPEDAERALGLLGRPKRK